MAPTLCTALFADTPSPELIVGVVGLGATTPRMGPSVSAADADPATTGRHTVLAPARWQAADAAQDGPLTRASGASLPIEEHRSRRPRARTGGLHHHAAACAGAGDLAARTEGLRQCCIGGVPLSQQHQQQQQQWDPAPPASSYDYLLPTSSYWLLVATTY